MGERTVDWDARTYDRLADSQEEWGREVLARLALAGDETVLDAGCGSGRVTRLLLERLPRGRIVAVDASPSMIEAVRSAFAGDERVAPAVADLTELELEQPVDAIFSNATFHWIGDHARLFSRLHAVLRPGGRVEAQCGGEGNVARWKRALGAVEGEPPFAPHLAAMSETYNFASVADTKRRLEAAGFEVDRVWLERRPARPAEPREYARAVGLVKHLDRLPGELHEAFLDAVMERMGEPFLLDYVRLNISARRPG